MKVEKMCRGRELNGFTCSPCGGLECSSWWPSCTAQNPRFLMHLVNCVYLFDEVLVMYPNFNKILCLKKTLYFIFIVKFVTIDHVGSRMTAINYVEYFIS